MPLYAGIEIGGTKLQLVVGDEAGKIIQRLKFGVEPAKGAPAIREQIQRAMPDLTRANNIESVGVGFGGPVDWKSGRICRSHQIEGWSEFDLGGWLGQLSGLPVFVDNDANAGALGEAKHGAGVGFNPVFYVTLGSGVGGGLVVEGKVYHGATPGEGGSGHGRLERSGTTVEARCSGWAVDAMIRQLRTKEPTAALARRNGDTPGGEAKQLAAALEQGDATARQVLNQTAEDLAFGLSHVVHLFHPEIIVLGGGLSGVGEPLRATVEKALRNFVMEAFAPGPRVALAELGEDAVPVGAVELARARMEDGRAGDTRCVRRDQ